VGPRATSIESSLGPTLIGGSGYAKREALSVRRGARSAPQPVVDAITAYNY